MKYRNPRGFLAGAASAYVRRKLCWIVVLLLKLARTSGELVVDVNWRRAAAEKLDDDEAGNLIIALDMDIAIKGLRVGGYQGM